MTFKKKITAVVVRFHPKIISKNGKQVRYIDVMVIGKGRSKNQWYQFTEVTEERDFLSLKVYERYEFTVFVNGLNCDGHHVNKLNISQAIPL